MKRLVILDLDGPVLDGRLRHHRCYADILEEHGVSPIPIEQYWEGKRDRVNRRELLALSDATRLYDEFLTKWIARIETRVYLALDRLQPRAVDVLEQWRQAGVRVVLATMRNHPENLRWQLSELGIAPLLDDVVVVGSDGAKGKTIQPHLGPIDAREVLWVGDTEVDVDAARTLGCQVCALTCGLRSAEYLRGLGPDQLASTLSDVDIDGRE